MKNTFIFIIILLSMSITQAQDIYVVNSNSQTLSHVNIENMTHTNTFAQIGLYGNHIEYHEDKLYVVNSGDQNIQIIHLNGSPTTYINLEDSSNPWHIKIYDGYIYVTGMVTGKLYKIDLNDYTNIAELSIGTGPQGMLIHDGKIYVAMTGLNYPVYGQGKIAIVDLNTYSLIDTIDVETNPQELIIDENGYFHVVCTGDYASQMTKIVIIDSQNYEIIHTLDFDWSFFTTIQMGAEGLIYIGSGYGLGFATYDPVTFEIINGYGNTLFSGGQFLLFDEQFIYVLEPSWYPNSFLNVFNHAHRPVHQFSIGLGATAMVLVPKPIPEIVKGPPKNLQGSATLPPPEKITLSWEIPEYSNTTLIEYKVYRNDIVINVTNELDYHDSDTEPETTYVYYITAVYTDGESEASNVFEFTTGTVSDFDLEGFPIKTKLLNNYPNPFNPETTITFRVGNALVRSENNASHIKINIYNIRGELVVKLLDKFMDKGEHSVVWNGLDEKGNNVGSGVYIYQMKAGGYVSAGKMVLLK